MRRLCKKTSQHRTNQFVYKLFSRSSKLLYVFVSFFLTPNFILYSLQTFFQQEVIFLTTYIFQLGLFKIWEKIAKTNFINKLQLSEIKSSIDEMNSHSNLSTVPANKIPWVSVHCFRNWASNSKKRKLRKKFPGTRVFCIVLSLEWDRHLVLSNHNVMSLQNNWINWQNDHHNQQFSTPRKVRQWQSKSMWEPRPNLQKIYRKVFFLIRNLNLIIFKITCYFPSINVLLQCCHPLKLCFLVVSCSLTFPKKTTRTEISNRWV